MKQIQENIEVEFEYDRHSEDIHDHILWMESRNFRRIRTIETKNEVFIVFRKENKL